MENPKCVLVIDPELPRWLIANTASVLSITLGERIGEFVGPDVPDESGVDHIGITQLPIPILQADPEQIKQLRNNAIDREDVFVVDFNRTAQSSKYYEEYIDRLAAQQPGEISYLGVGLYGHRKRIDKLIKGLPMLGA